MNLFSEQLHSLTIFRTILKDAVVSKFLQYLDTDEYFQTTKLDAYAEFTAELYQNGGNLGDYLFEKVMECKNPVVQRKAAGKDIPLYMQQALQDELNFFTALSKVSCEEIMPQGEFLPKWENSGHDFWTSYSARLNEITIKGYGIFAKYYMFTVGENGGFLPVKNPDRRKLSDLTGYEKERRQVIVNTLALLENLPANNILLYGDAGTGKSCTVKVLANEYWQKGLRLIEIRKNQLHLIPMLMDELAENPLKFILFIDDLSFSSGDESFTNLKAILEGTVSARPKNIVVYATSNRRHMLKQTFSERQGDDVHIGDTLEETMSLSARFGLTVTFLRPDKLLYSRIVESLAKEMQIKLSGEKLLQAAEAHASRQGGRSPRVARQFIEYQKAKELAEQLG